LEDIPYFKTETIRSQTGESKLTKTKTGAAKSSLYSISGGVRGKLSTNYFEVHSDRPKHTYLKPHFTGFVCLKNTILLA
jgi:hypothetical protein